MIGSDRLTLEEALGVLKISETSLRRTMREGLIAFVEPPHGPVSFNRADVEMFLLKYRRQAKAVGARAPGNVLELATSIALQRTGRASR